MIRRTPDDYPEFIRRGFLRPACGDGRQLRGWARARSSAVGVDIGQRPRIRRHDPLGIRRVDQRAHLALAGGHQRVDPVGQVGSVHRGKVVVLAVPRQHHVRAGLQRLGERARRSVRLPGTACRRRRRRPAGRRPRRPRATPARSPAAAPARAPRRASPEPAVPAAADPARRRRAPARSAARRCRRRARPSWCAALDPG